MKENILYLECYSGISGDMTVAALLDLGADQQVLLDGLSSLKVEGYKIEIGRRAKNSIDACDFNVILEQDEDHDSEHSHDAHDHDHTHQHNHVIHQDNSPDLSLEMHDHHHHHGHSHDFTHNHTHDDIHDDNHKNMHAHHKHKHPRTQPHIASATISVSSPKLILGHHEHRNLTDINHIIEQSEITEQAKLIAKKIFHIIAVAEAKAHAKPLSEVHFHEVGAIDSIVDIVAAAICLDNLNITKVIVSELYEGTGQIKCQHGLLPIPVPAVSNISTEHNLSLHITNVKGELVTPTGAAIVAAIKTSDNLPKEMKIRKIGLGAGKRNYPGTSGILRAMLIEDASSTNENNSTSIDHVWVLEANIDDCTGEMLSLAMELLLQNGAKDVYYTPIFMKKNRPAYLLGVICMDEKVSELEGIIFNHTTTIGIRKHRAERTILPREQKLIMTSYGEAEVKVCKFQNNTFIYPEYESIKRLCQKSGLDYLTMYQAIREQANDIL